MSSQAGAPTAQPAAMSTSSLPSQRVAPSSVSSAAALQSETARLLAALPPHLQIQMQQPSAASSAAANRTASGGTNAPAPPSRPAPARPNMAAAAAATAATVAAGSAAPTQPQPQPQHHHTYAPKISAPAPSTSTAITPLAMAAGFTSPLRAPQSITSSSSSGGHDRAALAASMLAAKQQQKNPDAPQPPQMPEWTRFRGAALSLNPPGSDLVSCADSGDYPSIDSFNALPPEVQEQLLLEHVLYALLAIEGRYIRVAKQKEEEMPDAHAHSGQGRSYAQSSQAQQAQAHAAQNAAPARVHFVVDPAIRDASMVALVSRLLPAANAYYAVQCYVQSHSTWGGESGSVVHALSAALRTILREYLVLVAQLEHQYAQRKLTLLRAWYYVQPALHSLARLERLCARVERLKGGALLNVLHASMSAAGDAATKELYAHLLSASSAPYFAMLRLWLTRGLLQDPCDEFMVRGDVALRKENVRRDFNDTYWDERYTLRQGQVPAFLAHLAEKILTTGKYLNVIRECGRSVEMSLSLASSAPPPALALAPAPGAAGVAGAEDENDGTGAGGGGGGSGSVHTLCYSSNDRAYTEPIERLHSAASALLLRLLLDESDLLGRLRSIKSYFLFAQGDFFTHWMDLTAEELSKRAHSISPQKLQSLLQLAVKTTGARADPYAEDLACHLQQYSLVQKLEAIHNTATAGGGAGGSIKPAAVGSGAGAAAAAGAGLHGYDSVTLSYRVGWPLSLILSKKTLTKYQLLFRHLYAIRHTERLLHGCWGDHQGVKGLELGAAYRGSFALRHRMLHLFHSLAYYIMAEVLEPRWHMLELELQRVSTVDQVLRAHASFLDQCLKQCLLTNQALLKSIQKLIVTARHFAEHAELTMNSGTAAAARRGGGMGGGAGADSDEEDSSSHRSHRRTGSMDEPAARRAPPTLQQRADSIAFHTRVTLAAVADPRHQATIAAHCAAFDDNLFALLAQLKAKSQQGSDAHFSNLYQRLDYNDWYAQYFKNQQAAAAAQKAARK